MELAAIIVVGARREVEAAAANNHHEQGSPENFAGIPLALLDVAGKSVVHHVADRLRRLGVDAVSVLTDEGLRDNAISEESKTAWTETADVWRAAEDVFSEYATQGAENVLFLRLGAYAEIDIADLLRFHLDRRQYATLIGDENGPLDAVVVQSARRNDAAFVLRNRLRTSRLESEPYLVRGCVNRLESARDLRRLAQDALLMRCGIRPAGREIKPGVWAAERARIHRSARVLAPAFIGAHAKVRAAAVVTRGSVVEHHAEVDCGTVLEDATVLPYTYVGQGLDMAHTVAGFGQVFNLRREAQVEIDDTRLLGTVTTSASWRTLKSAASLASYLPVQAVRGLMGAGRRVQPVPSPESGAGSSPQLERPAVVESSPETSSESNGTPQFAADFAVVRRYGNE